MTIKSNTLNALPIICSHAITFVIVIIFNLSSKTSSQLVSHDSSQIIFMLSFFLIFGYAIQGFTSAALTFSAYYKGKDRRLDQM